MADAIAKARKDFEVSNEAMAGSDAFPMMPERILADIREVMPRNAILTTDVGWNKNGVGQQFPIYTPGSVLTPGGFATMGFGPPAALGAKIAAPIASSSRWSATAASARTQRCLQRPAK